MIVLDTNVVSETVRRAPDVGVLAWLDAQTDQLALTAITVGELWTGVRQLPDGARRDGLASAIRDVLVRWAVILPYDAAAAEAFAAMRGLARRSGRGLSVEDGMIAAICAVRGATLATRNVPDFDFLPILLVNPWSGGAGA